MTLSVCMVVYGFNLNFAGCWSWKMLCYCLCKGLLFSELSKLNNGGSIPATTALQQDNRSPCDPPPAKRRCGLFSHYTQKTQSQGTDS